MNVFILFLRSVVISSQAERHSGSTQKSILGDVLWYPTYHTVVHLLTYETPPSLGSELLGLSVSCYVFPVSDMLRTW